MKIMVLCNDIAKDGFFREHGLSLLIDEETLFDTGTSDVALKNAHKLGVNLSRVKRIFISHGHYDHAGGLIYLLKEMPNVDLYIHKKAIIPKYSEQRFAGIPYDWKEIEEKAHVHFVEGNMEVDGFKIINNVPTVEKNIDSRFLIEGKHDLFEDELNLYKNGILITGCAHRGIDNIAKKARESFPVSVVMGGFHLKDSSIERIEEVLEFFQRYKVKIVPLHCTGEMAINLFKDKMKDKCVIVKAGESIEL